ncbi:MAG: GGDEF domain-containing protein [Pseudomonadota bacterium]|nr:GGDEF domain-containing protein [Pseudomonadota bacterium]
MSAFGTRVAPGGAVRSRAALLRRIGRSLESAQRHDFGCVLLRLQLSGLDVLLRQHGDAFVENALRVVVERLRRQVRMDDLVARTGNDEFALIAQGVEGPRHPAGEAIAARVLDSLTKAYGVDGIRFQLGLRIGIAGYPDDATDPSALLLGASQALHAARRLEQDGWRVAAPSSTLTGTAIRTR